MRRIVLSLIALTMLVTIACALYVRAAPAERTAADSSPVTGTEPREAPRHRARPNVLGSGSDSPGVRVARRPVPVAGRLTPLAQAQDAAQWR